jgi:hypothetical protein
VTASSISPERWCRSRSREFSFEPGQATAELLPLSPPDRLFGTRDGMSSRFFQLSDPMFVMDRQGLACLAEQLRSPAEVQYLPPRRSSLFEAPLTAQQSRQ